MPSRHHNGVLISLVIFASSATAAINLDKLTDCKEISDVWTDLASAQPHFAASCRSPAPGLEQALANRADPDKKTLCFLGKPPASFLSGFSCGYFRFASDSVLLTCFKGASLSDVTDFKAHYPQAYGKSVAAYLATAARCPSAINHDTAMADPAMFSAQLRRISQFEFGFRSSLGALIETDNGPMSGNYVIHGYASVDPTIVGNDFKAIEFFQITASTQAPSTKSVIKHVGSWTVSMDNMDQINAIKTTELEAKGAHGFYNFTIFDITNPRATDPLAMKKKLALQSHWKDVLVQSLVDKDFKVLSNEELVKVMGMSYEQYRNALIAGQDYGGHKTHTVLGKRILVLQNIACEEQDGGLLGYISSIEPTPDVAADFGSIALVFVEIDTCKPADLDSRHFLDKALGNSKASLFKSMEVDQ